MHATGGPATRSWRLVVALMLVVLAPLCGGAQERPAPLLIGPDFAEARLSPHLEYLEDPSGEWTPADLLTPEVASQFRVNEHPIFSAGLVRSPFWFRFGVKNLEAIPREVVLYLDHEYRSLDLYVQGSDGVQPVASKQFASLLDSGASREEVLEISFTLEAGAEQTYLLRLDTQFEMKAMLSVWVPEVRHQQNLVEYHFYGWVWGGVLIFAIFFGIIYLSIRDPVYLYYSLFLVSFLYFRILERIWVDLFAGPGEGTYWLALLMVLATIIFGLRFAQRLLNLSGAYPRLNLLTNLIVLVILLVLLVSEDVFTSYAVVSLATIIAAPWTWVMGILSWRKHNEVAKFFLAGLGNLLLVTLAMPLMALGVLDYHPYYRPAIDLAALLDCVLFSMALAIRFRRTYLERDEAQRRVIDGLQENERLRNNFLANVSHELRTPLHGMIGLAESVLSEAQNRFSEQAVKQLNLIVSNGRRLNELVDNLLELSLGRNQPLEVHPEAVPLAPLVQEVMGLLSSRASGGLVMHNQVSLELPLVQVDRARLEQVLINLLGNAQKYAGEGAITVRASLQEEWVRVEVVDEGPGVPEKDRQRIFKAFEQGTTSARQSGSGLGLGLGLSISQEIIKAHGGTMGVSDSLPQRGSVFWFTVPLSKEEASEEARASLAEPLPASLVPEAPLILPKPKNSSSSGNVLVVDDEVTNLYIILNYLAPMNLTIHSCTSGQEALERYQQQAFDLVLLDVRMPNMDGYEVCEVLRQTSSKEQLPILFLSALTRSEDLALGFQAGANDYLFKPIVKAELLARVHSHLELAQLKRGHQSQEAARSQQVLLAEAMQTCVRVWEQELHQDLVELAQSSGLWGAYLDKTNSVWKAPSIKRYLTAGTIPDKPRWRKVLQTIEFLLPQLKSSHPEHARLMAHYHEIRQRFS
jgi:signal transduction histidine kinase/DNA-binding response OmpR family regulator